MGVLLGQVGLNCSDGRDDLVGFVEERSDRHRLDFGIRNGNFTVILQIRRAGNKWIAGLQRDSCHADDPDKTNCFLLFQIYVLEIRRMEMANVEQSVPSESTVHERILHLPRYLVVVCRPCGHCMRPKNGIQRHLKDMHQDWSLQLRKDIVAYTAGLELAEPDQMIPLMTAAGPPVTGLIVHRGFRCLDCPYLCVTVRTMQEHSRGSHGWTKAKGELWRSAKIQTFFQSDKTRFFEVTEPVDFTAAQSDGNSLLETLLEEGRRLDKEETAQCTVMDDTRLQVDLTPWMRKTGWIKRFAGQDLREIASQGQRPDKDDIPLLRVWDSVGRIMARCRVSISEWREMEEDGDLILCWLNSPRKDQFNPEPFSVFYETATHERYISFWRRFICYCFRMTVGADSHGHEVNKAESGTLKNIWMALLLDSELDETAAEIVLDKTIFDLSVRYWMHTSTRESRSEILHFSAILGIDGARGCFRQPSEYGQILAGLLYCARLLLFEHALPRTSRTLIERPLDCFMKVHDDWLIDGQATPFNSLNNLLAYARAAGRDAGGRNEVHWSRDRQTLIYEGQNLALTDFRRFLRDIIKEAGRILSHDLMFLSSSDEVDRIRLDLLRDNMNDSTVGYSFVTHPGNQFASGREKMLRRLLTSSTWAGLIRMSRTGIDVDSRLWMVYERRLKEFRGLLAVLMHISGGPPARGSEILSIRHVNAPQNIRNIFILDGQVIFVTAYHKSQALTRQQKVITRFLPTSLGRMLVAFLSEVLPFVRFIERGAITMNLRNFLWADKSGLWDTSKLTDVFTRETSLRLGMRVTVQIYRHLAIVIDRQHVRGLMMDTVKDQQTDNVHDLGASHSSHTAELSYAIDASMLRGMSAMTVAAFREVAQRWHRFLDLDDLDDLDDKKTIEVKRSRASSQNWELPERKRIHSMNNEKRHSLIDEKLKELMGVDARFRSVEQREAISAVLTGEGPLVVVLPTGGGKSLVFQLPAALSMSGVTVVVVPFRALAVDLVNRCTKLGIDSVYWTSIQSRQTRLVVVVMDTAITDAFMEFLTALRLNGRLDRIVIDECHVVIHSHKLRSRLQDLENLRKIPCQFVLLTGTLPPQMQKTLETSLLLGSRENGLRYIRASTNRPMIKYRIECHADNQLLSRLKNLIVTTQQKMTSTERILVFCFSRGESEKLAAFLDCQPYHSKLIEKEESLSQWMNGEMTVIVATSALGTGVDIPGIRMIIHYDAPHTLTDFYQEVGRGGRNGEKVESLILLKIQKFQWYRQNIENPEFVEKRNLWLFLITTECRRRFLTNYFDGVGQTCYQNNDEFCDNCTLLSQQKTEFEQFQKDEETRWEIGPILYRTRVQDRAKEKEIMDRLYQEMSHVCVVCWILTGKKENQTHKELHCSHLAILKSYQITQLLKIINSPSNIFCYRCKRPGDWCQAYTNRKKCNTKDVIFFVVLTGWEHEIYQKQLQQLSDTTELESFLQWLGQSVRIGWTNGINMMKAGIFIANLIFEQSEKK